MTAARRVVSRVAAVAALLVGILAGSASAAIAHPLGNATVNHYDGLVIRADRVADRAVEDIAEIPTLQRKPDIDTNGDGIVSAPERAAYATRQCGALAAANSLTLDGRRLPLTVSSSEYSERPGAIRLQIGRLVCELGAPVRLTGPADLVINDEWDGAGIGWHEITAVETGVELRASPFPAASISGELLRYPNDLLSSPLNVRGGTVRLVPGAGTSSYLATRRLPVAGPAVRALNRLATTFNGLVGAKNLTVGVGLLAILLSMLLGAGHAFLPGHGKTIMAAYLVGRRGRIRDVVTVGATVTLTHTAGVLVLGLLISVTSAFAPTAAEQYLGILSGLIVAGVGVGLLVSAVRRRHNGYVPLALAELGLLDAKADLPAATRTGGSDQPAAVRARVPTALPEHEHAVSDRGLSLVALVDHPGHEHGTADHHHPGQVHGAADHHHGDEQRPEHARGTAHDGVLDTPHHHGLLMHRHSHSPHSGRSEQGFTRSGLIGLGIAGGLVPSPSALLVLLAAIALGRTVFGVVLVLGYGLGMAVALSAAGLMLVGLRERLIRMASGRRFAGVDRLLGVMPVITATLVLVVGVWLALRAASGTV